METLEQMKVYGYDLFVALQTREGEMQQIRQELFNLNQKIQEKLKEQQDSEPTATRMRIGIPVDLHGFQKKSYFIDRDRINT